MLNIPLFGADTPTAVRRPAFEVRFGGAQAEDWEHGLVALTVEAGLGPAVDVVEVSAAVPEGDLALGDSGSVALGYVDAATDEVFSGTVDSLSRSLDGTLRLTATNGGAALSRLRLAKSWEQGSAADVIRDLAGEAEVPTSAVEADLDFDFYVVDERHNGYEHVCRLARRCGCRSSFNPQGELEVVPFTVGTTVASFAYGESVIVLEVSETTIPVTGFRTVGEGAAGSQGRDAASWLVKDPSALTAQAGDPPRRAVADPALRSTAAVKTAAAGRTALAGLGALRGHLLVPGTAALAPGAAFEITGAPDERLNGTFLVRHVVHRYTKDTGFQSRVSFFGASAGGGLAGLLGGLL